MLRVLLSVLLIVVSCLGADARFPRGSLNNTLAPSQRTIVNMNFMDGTYEYRFIDHVLSGDRLSPTDHGDFTTPAYYATLINPQWATGSNNANLDTNGYAQNLTVADSASGGRDVGNHVLLPDSTNYGAVNGHGYMFQWTGDCQFNLTGGTWTTRAHTVTNFTDQSAGNRTWAGTTGTVTATFDSGSQGSYGWRIQRTGHLTGAYCRDVKIYRQDDAADLAAGNVFRTAWKQLYVSQDPSGIRFMNWHGGNDAYPSRWNNRAPYPHSQYGGAVFTQSPPYGNADWASGGTVQNVYTLGSATGMPVAMQHGEMATFRIKTSAAKIVGGGVSISAVANCNGNVSSGACTCSAGNGQITAVAHGFVTNDVIVFLMPTNSSMKQLNLYQATATRCDNDHLNINVDTTAFSTYTSGGSVSAYITMNVGVRGAYPIMSSDGETPLGFIASNPGTSGVNYFHQYDTRTLYFDKTIAGSRDGSGNLVAGVWIIQAQSNGNIPEFFGQQLLTPPEICAQMIKEMNAMSPAHRIDMYLNIGARALMSMDPDYSAADNYTYNAVNAAKSILPSNVHIFVEYSNETWNRGASAFTDVTYVEARAYLRSSQPYGDTAVNYFTAVRSVVLANDLIAGLGNDPRVHMVLAGQGVIGIDPSAGITNYVRAFGDNGVTTFSPTGTSLYYNDAAISGLATISKTGTTHASTTVDSIASTAGLNQGMWVTCSDCGTGLQITAVGANSITLNAAASGSHAGVALTIARAPINYHWGWAAGYYFDPPTQHTASFTGVIAGTTLTATGVDSPTLSVGDFIVCSGCSTNPNTVITALGSGTGGDGTYTITPSQTVSSRAMTKDQYMHYATGTGTFTDDSAMYNGTNNTGNGGGNYTGVANTAQAITNFVAQVNTGGDSQSVARFKAIVPTYSAAFAPIGVYSIGYEGMGEWQVFPGETYGGHLITSNDNLFLIAAQGSASWSTVAQSWLTSYRSNSFAVMPPFYVGVECRWGFTSVNNGHSIGGTCSPDTYSGGVEGAAFNTTWTTNGTLNQAISP